MLTQDRDLTFFRLYLLVQKQVQITRPFIEACRQLIYLSNNYLKETKTQTKQNKTKLRVNNL